MYSDDDLGDLAAHVQDELRSDMLPRLYGVYRREEGEDMYVFFCEDRTEAREYARQRQRVMGCTHRVRLLNNRSSQQAGGGRRDA